MAPRMNAEAATEERGGAAGRKSTNRNPKPSSRFTGRIEELKAAGLNYSLPKCTFSKWTIAAGGYEEYAVGRSLEGPFFVTTSQAIVNDADISKTTVAPGEILIWATDGLWEVMDSEEVALDLYKMRYEQRMSARDAVRSLCSLAIRKGTLDNVSVVVVYL